MRVRYTLTAALVIAVGCDDPVSVVNAKPEVIWQVPSQSATTAPVIIDGLVILGTTEGFAVALDKKTGETKWKRKLDDTEVHGSEIRAAAGLAIVPQYKVWALDPSNGVVRWKYGGPDGTAGLRDVATSGDTVFTGSWYGWASAVDARTGNAFWSVDLEESPFDPAVADELVIYGTRGFVGPDRQHPLGPGHLVALRRLDGSEAWRFELPSREWVHGGAVNGGVVCGDRVVVGTTAGDVFAVTLEEGELIWHYSGDRSYSLAPATLGDVVIFGEGDLSVIALDLETGVRRWGWERPATISRPVVRGRYVYFLDGPIEVVDSQGTVVWKYGGLGYGALGVSFWRGTVSENGVIYTLGTERTGQENGLYAFALRPPVKP